MISIKHTTNSSLTQLFRKSTTRLPLSVFLGILFLNSCSFFAPRADNNKSVHEWLVIPIFYATNRVFAGGNGPIDYLEESNQNGLSFGVKNIVCPTPENTPLDSNTPSKMLWQKVQLQPSNQADGPHEIDMHKCIIKDKVLEKTEIVPAFAAYVKKTGSHESVLFVHGCCVNFDTAMERAALLAAHMQAPVVLYDWVSPKGFRNYLQNETRAEQTMDGFCHFLTNVEKVTDPKNIILLGHSMGNEFIDRSMTRRSSIGKSSPFKEIIMANADVDAQSFLNHANEVTSNAQITRIYVSSKDSKLNASCFAHGGFNRLGSPGSLISKLARIDRADVIDITEANSDHELLYWLVANMHKYNNVGPVKDFGLKILKSGYRILEKTAVASSSSGNN